jgi:hypothetical protein
MILKTDRLLVSGGKMVVEISDKTEPTIIDKKLEKDYSTYLWAILILAVIAIFTVIAIKK